MEAGRLCRAITTSAIPPKTACTGSGKVPYGISI
nr:MAG TPA: hypothetical protein [Caudoviricetes sp.]